jgi:hypothetical protein
VGRFPVRHRPNDAQLVGDRRRLLHRLAEQLARNLGLNLTHLAAIFDRGIRLRVERLLMSHPPRQIDMDDRLGRPFKVFVVLEVRLGTLHPQHIAQVQSAQSGQRAHRQESTPRHRLEMRRRTTHRGNQCLVHVANHSGDARGTEKRLDQSKSHSNHATIQRVTKPLAGELPVNNPQPTCGNPPGKTPRPTV